MPRPVFSLVETMMQLVLLVVVAIPMMMMMNLQKADLNTAKAATQTKAVADQLMGQCFHSVTGFKHL